MKYELKSILEKGAKNEVLVEVRSFSSDDMEHRVKSEQDANDFFEEQKKEGYVFLKAFSDPVGCMWDSSKFKKRNLRVSSPQRTLNKTNENLRTHRLRQ